MYANSVLKLGFPWGVLYVNVVGGAEEWFIDLVVELIKEIYSVLGSGPELLEIYIYESSETKRRVLVSEAQRLGISVIGDYPVSHDAWMSWPRIHVDYGACRSLRREYLRALLYHEAVHSIFHGSLASYIVRTGDLRGLLEADLLETVYLASVVVKDIEVHSYLAERGLNSVLRDYYEYTSNSLRKVHCNSLLGLLELAKLISPCLYVDCNNASILLHETCRGKVPELLSVLEKIKNTRGDLSSKIQKLLEEIILAHTKRPV
jgi:hypothetical protein